MKTNTTKQLIHSGKPAFGCWIKTGSPAAIEVAGKVGFDFVLLDTEHGAYDYYTTENLIRAADVFRISTVVRVEENRQITILKAFDSGAHGVLVPHIDNKEDAEKAVKAAKYAPEGERGSAFSQRSADWGFADAKTYTADANEFTMISALIESADGVENIEDIVSVEGIDIVHIGPSDLSQSMGYPKGHPAVKEAIDTIIATARRANVAVGIGTKDAESALKLIEKGVQFIHFGSDLGMFGKRSIEILADLKR